MYSRAETIIFVDEPSNGSPKSVALAASRPSSAWHWLSPLVDFRRQARGVGRGQFRLQECYTAQQSEERRHVDGGNAALARIFELWSDEVIVTLTRQFEKPARK
jgi:hypothetical protein